MIPSMIDYIGKQRVQQNKHERTAGRALANFAGILYMFKLDKTDMGSLSGLC